MAALGIWRPGSLLPPAARPRAPLSGGYGPVVAYGGDVQRERDAGLYGLTEVPKRSGPVPVEAPPPLSYTSFPAQFSADLLPARTAHRCSRFDADESGEGGDPVTTEQGRY